MKRWWQSYRSKFYYQHKDTSIPNDEVTLLAKRLEFFLPKSLEIFTISQWMIYVICLSLFLTILAKDMLQGWSDFWLRYLIEFGTLFFTTFPSLVMIEYWRPSLKKMTILQACFQIWLIVFVNAFIAQSVASLLEISWGRMMNTSQFIIISVITALFSSGFAIIFLSYFLYRHRELLALKISFEQKLAAQNDLIKARLAPHSFFNTLNTLMSLIESDPKKASALLQNISHLFRASFSEPKEISFEEEMMLCEHYLSIESSRLGDKLVIYWDLPDDEIMYDIVITAMTLQRVLEQTLLHVVEMATETIYLSIKVAWINHQVNIEVTANLPQKTLLVSYDLHTQMDFRAQAERLRLHFGDGSNIKTFINNHQVKTLIFYPLHDAGSF